MNKYENDIVTNFPEAKALSENSEMYSLFLFEEELRSLFRLLTWGASTRHNPINVAKPSKEAIEFLEEKGYIFNHLEDGTSWIYY